MGYIIAICTVALAVLVIASILMSRGRGVSRGQLPSDHPLQVDKPAADEPTPAASDTAPASVAAHAQKRTPPA